MATGEIISVIALCFSCFGVVSAFIFSSRKASKESENERKEKDRIMQSLLSDVGEIKQKVEKIDDRMFNDHEKVVDHEARIKNLEKEVFKKGA
jgi:hypothetical protein